MKPLARTIDLPDGRSVQQVVLRGEDGLCLETCGLGAAVMRLTAFDRHRRAGSVVLGLANAADYLGSKSFFGATVGRFANRIDGAGFRIGDSEFKTDANEGANTLHGGRLGFHRALWSLAGFDESRVRYELMSPDGDMGFPGRVEASATYTLSSGGGYIIEYEAICDQPTMLGLANHTYFNLRGEGCGDIGTHEVAIFAESYLPVRPDLIPRGEMCSVANSAFDLRTPRPLAEALACEDPQLALTDGFDHNYCLRPARGEVRMAARVREPASGRVLTVRSTEPGLQLYTGQKLDSSEGRDGVKHARHAGLCIEAQIWPNAPNEPTYPSALLIPGDRYTSRTSYSLCVESDIGDGMRSA